MKTSYHRRGMMGCVLGIVLALGWPAAPGLASAQQKAKPTEEARGFTFEVRDMPWGKVFEWLAQETGLPVVGTSSPTGTFSFVPTASKKYTLGQVVDIINEGLMSKKHLLMRREQTFVIVPADERIDPALVPRVRLDDLSARGQTELVSVVIALEKLAADEFAPELKKLLGPYGEVIVLARANQLVVRDVVGNLRRVVETVRAVDERERGAAEPKQKPDASQAPILRTYPVPGGNAQAFAKLLQEAHKEVRNFRITALGPHAVMVYAVPEDHIEIARQLEQGARTSTELISLSLLDASKVSETLRSMFGDARTGGPFVEADTDRNALILRGSAAQLQEVNEVLRALGEGTGPKGGMRMLNLQQGSAGTLAEALQRLLTDMRPNLRVRVILPAAQAAGTPPNAETDKKGAKAGKGETLLTITATGNRLIVVCDDAQALALSVELFRLMTSTGPSDAFDVIRLKHAQARNVARLLDEAFNGNAPKGGGIGMPRGERVRVIADPATNSLLLKANPLDSLTIRRLLQAALDIEGAGNVPDEVPDRKGKSGKKGAD